MKGFLRRTTSFFLAAVLTASLVLTGIPGGEAVFASARSKVWNGKADTSWYTGDKISYDISTAEQLAGLAELTNNMQDEDQFRGITINLTKDIVLNKTNNFKKWDKKPPKNSWTPIGQRSELTRFPAFAGNFNGNGHKIIGLYMDASGYGLFGGSSDAGLFGCVCYGSVMNLKIEKAYLKAYGSIGAVAAVSQGSVFMNVEVSDSNIGYGSDGAAGIVGASYKAAFSPETVVFLSLAMMGVLINPLLLMGGSGIKEDFNGTILYNCKANKLNFAPADGSYGYGGTYGLISSCDDNGVGIVNCLVTDSKGLYGALSPYTSDKDTHIIKNSYYCGLKLEKKSGQKNFADSKTAKKITKGKLKSKQFAKKLGKGYSWKKGKAPVLNNYIPGSEVDKAKLSKTYRTLDDGYYSISNGWYITVGNTDSEGYAYTSADPSYYYFTYRDDGYYTITAPNGKLLELDTASGKLITKNNYDPSKYTQRWLVSSSTDLDNNPILTIHSPFRGGYISYDPGWLFVSGRGLYVDTSGSSFSEYGWEIQQQ